MNCEQHKVERYRTNRYFYGTDGIDYICCHTLDGAADDLDGWDIWKFTYSGGDLSRSEGPLSGTVDGRADLDWI